MENCTPRPKQCRSRSRSKSREKEKAEYDVKSVKGRYEDLAVERVLDLDLSELSEDNLDLEVQQAVDDSKHSTYSIQSLRHELRDLKESVQLLLRDRERKRPLSRSPSLSRSRSKNKRMKGMEPQRKRDGDDLDYLSSHSEGEIIEDSADEDLQELESFFEANSSKGDKIDDRLAIIIDNGLCKKLREEKIQELGDKYLAPANSKNIRVPRTNPEIWKLLSKAQKSRDMKLQKVHNLVTKIITASVRMLHTLRTARKDGKEINMRDVEATSSDIIRLTSACYIDISSARKESMKSGITEKFRPLCTKDDNENQSTGFLFGDNLAQKIKDLGESSKLSSTLGPPYQRRESKNFQRGRPYQKFRRSSFVRDDPRNQGRNQKTTQSFQKKY